MRIRKVVLVAATPLAFIVVIKVVSIVSPQYQHPWLIAVLAALGIILGIWGLMLLLLDARRIKQRDDSHYHESDLY